MKSLNAPPEAVVFDADGTLFDTFEMIVAAYRHVSVTHGLRVPATDEIRAQLGNALSDIFENLYPGQNIEELLRTNNDYVTANVMKSDTFAGLNDLLDKVAAAGYKMAILTSGSNKVHDILGHHGIAGYFSSVVTPECIQYPKPHPEGFYLATLEMGVDPVRTVMVGDTVQDILTGKHAPAYTTIALTHGYGLRDDLVNAGADHVVDNLSAVSDILLDLKPFST